MAGRKRRLSPKVVYLVGASMIFGVFNGSAALILGWGPIWAYLVFSLSASILLPIIGALEASD
jgi:hypothetical protein